MAPTGEWRLVPDAPRPGPLQMALDEVAARTAADGGPRTVRLYTWSPGTLSMGYTQDPATVDWAYCEREGIDVTRRQTGGGGIYHDEHGDLSYAICAPVDEFPGELLAAYHALLEPVLDGFDRLGVDVGFVEEEQPPIYEPACYLRGLHPAHDLAVDGRKISGNAQYRQRDAVIQHGSLTYARATDRHLGVFAEPPAPDVFEGRVTSIREHAGVGRDQAVEAFASALRDWCDATVGAFTDAELASARELAERKYAAEGWVRDRAVAER